jgi:flagellar biosynthesis/type III secretory pathway protein FliH
VSPIHTHEQKRKLRISGAGCGENRTPRSNREGRSVIAPLDSNRLLNRQRQQKQTLSHLRHKAQKRAGENFYGESNLGKYIDRLIAKAIIELAKQYQVSAIAVPKNEDIREIVQSEIKAKAEAKIPGYEEGQKKYAKQYRINIHNWSYGRLTVLKQ